MHARRTGVNRPSWLWFALIDGGILSLAVLGASESTHASVNDAMPTGLPPQKTLRRMLVGVAVIHLAEARWAGRMARRRGLSPGGWRLQTFVVGFPSLFTLRRIPKG